MAIELPDLTTLNSEAVDQAHAYIVQRVSEYSPNVETRRGVLYDILFHLEAILQTGQDQYADVLRKSGSLLAVSQDPTLATDEVLDEIASNFRATRYPGSNATGRAVIVINQFIPSSVSIATTFSADGKTFTPTATFFGRTSQSQIVNSTDSLIKPVGDGTFYYTIQLTADAVGADGNIKRNTKLTPSTSIPYFVTAYAESSFTSGADYENNEAFVTRLQEGISSKNVSNRKTINAMIRDQAAFKSILDISSIGFGDAEQVRYHSLFPIASGNRLDIYTQVQPVPSTVKVTKTATLVGRKNGGGLWQVAILKNDLPGFYDINKILKSDVVDSDTQTGLEIDQDARSFDLSGESTTFLPDITNAAEAAYSCFQTSVVRFIDTTTDPQLSVGSTASYDLFLRGMPQIRALQDFVAGRDVRPTAGDVLVKAPVPCDLRLSFVIYKKLTDAAIDTDAIKKALADKVNNMGFVGRLAASTLHSVIHEFLNSTQTASSIEMFGKIRKPDGTLKFIRDFDILEIPNEPSAMVSPKTAIFILDSADVGLSVQNVDDLTS
jgi:hypothetical protein